MLPKHQVVAAALFCSVVWFCGAAAGQEVCLGDVNGDGVVDTEDVQALPAVLFDGGEIDTDTLLRADANDDGHVDAADAVAILNISGKRCAPTPTRTFTATRPPTSTPTQTSTPPPTPTATAVCAIQTLSLGTTNGELSANDCQREFGSGDVRYTDVYSIVGTPGQAIKIDVAATGGAPTLVPFVAIIDPNGEFDRVDDIPPMEFVVTSSRPYLVFVTSRPATPAQLGTYALTAAARTCPTPSQLTVPALLAGQLVSGDCPDPAAPSTGNQTNPVDVYTFTVIAAQVPMNLQIVLRQRNYADSIDPIFSLSGPDGYELFSADEDNDAAPGINDPNYPGLDAGARFLATVPGTYTLVVGGNGGVGLYALSVLSPGSPACAPKPLGPIPSLGQLTVNGQLFGDYTKGCGPPLPIPGVSDEVPEPNSGADVYTFTAAAGDVISVEMDSDDEPHLFLYGPASAGNPRVAQDDYTYSGTYGSAQLAATLVQPGTYTIVAANNNAWAPPDPSDSTDPGDIVSYSLSVQKCPVAGALPVGAAKAATFGSMECLGFGGLPVRSYGFVGNAGDFVSISMTSSEVDAAVKLLGPDGSQLYNDDDLFDAMTTDARVNRILPVSGTYFVEVSTSPSSGPVDLTPPPPGFTVQVQRCPTIPVPAQTLVTGAFEDSDCELAPGRKYDVYTFSGPIGGAQRAASIAPPSNGCVLGLLAQGVQAPNDGCGGSELVEMPVITSGPYGFMVVAGDETVRGNYSFQFNSCPLSTVTFGDTRNGTLSAASCAAADGLAGNWYLVRGTADLVNFNAGVSGSVTTGFSGTVTDFGGASGFVDSFADDADSMLPLGRDLAALLKVSGPPFGNYVLSIDTATKQQ